MSGRLLIVSTPIGNLSDLSSRAEQSLREVSLVACEDTRRTLGLLSHLGLRTPLVSLHEHNEARRLPDLLARLAAGETIALVSDAGTPLLSDPGFQLVRAAVAAGARVEAVPGPSAILAALVVSGLPPYPFTFAGFAPPRSGRRKSFFERFAALEHTVVFFESPHRITASLADLAMAFEERPVALVRELTKLHEEALRGTAQELLVALEARPPLRGELVLVVGPKTKKRIGDDPDHSRTD